MLSILPPPALRRPHTDYSDQTASIGGAHRAVWGQDFGFAADGTTDGVTFRRGIIDEAKRQHAAGSVITLMWHGVRPTEDESVTFEDSICNGKLSDQDWQDLLTTARRPTSAGRRRSRSSPGSSRSCATRRSPSSGGRTTR